MKYLLDAHTLIWTQDDPSRLGAGAAAAVQGLTNELIVGAGTIWEISIKVGQGKLTLSQPLRPWLDDAIADLDLVIMPITIDHAAHQSTVPYHHRDPFDRLLVAQSLVEGIPVVGDDAIFDRYGVRRIWH